MKKCICIFIVFTMITVTVFADENIKLSAKSAIVIDTLTGSVIFEKDPYQQMPMASTTKIMTAICAIENGNMDDVVKVDDKAVGVEGSTIYLAKNESLTLRELVYGLMLSSGNDAAVAIAMHISGSIDEFAALMNETAKKIGVQNTSFKNPNGLDAEGHYTTAYDLAQITRYGMGLEDFKHIVDTEEINVSKLGIENGRRLKNHNKMLKFYEGADGVKTGFTKKSGRCLVSSATRNGFQVIVVTLNAPNDWDDHIKMLDYAFENCSLCTIIKKGDFIKTVSVKNGILESVKAVCEDDFKVPVKNGITDNIKIEYNIDESVESPVGFNQELGSVKFSVDGREIGSVKAISDSYVATENIKKYKDSFYKVIREWVLMYSNNIYGRFN